MPWVETLPSGNYRAGYRIPSGKKRYVEGTFTHKRAAERAATQAEADAHQLGWRDPQAAQRLWGEWAAEWFESRRVEASTLSAERYVLPRLMKKWGETPIHEITRYEVKVWASELLAEGLAHSSVLKHISLLSGSLTDAADAEIIPANPALRLKLGLVPGENERVLDVEEQHRLFAAFAPAADASDLEYALAMRDQALVATLIGSGGRWGEAVALAPFHFTEEGIRYRRAWDNANRIMKDYTKGKKRRTVPLAPWLLEIIAPALEANPHGLIFTASNGMPLNRQNWTTRRWKPAIERAKLNQGEHSDLVSPHTLRHTYATMQLEAGRTIAEIADLLGHSSMSMAERYAHRRGRVSQDAALAVPDPRKAPVQDKPLPANVLPFRRRS